jgi:hypothetical protein
MKTTSIVDPWIIDACVHVMPFFAMRILHHDDCWMKPTSIVDPWIIDSGINCDAAVRSIMERAIIAVRSPVDLL